MNITYDESRRIFKLDTEHSSYCMGLTPEGYLGHIYYGPYLTNIPGNDKLRLTEAMSPTANPREKQNFMDSFPWEYPTAGSGDMRLPALSVLNPAGQRISELIYQEHAILCGKPQLPDMPQTHAGDDAVKTLVVRLGDAQLGLRVELYYSVFAGVDALVRRARITNTSNEKLTLERALSFALEMDDPEYDALSLSGSWGRERAIDRSPLHKGITEIRSVRGVSSHQENPFLAVLEPTATQQKGEVIGMNLVYSGGFTLAAERTQTYTMRLVGGIGPDNFRWDLAAGKSFDTPEAVLVYSQQGIGGMTRTFHDLYRRYLIRSPYLHKDRPVLINNWEATYFDFDEEKLYAIARDAHEAGIELFVMDDGWFGVRNDDTTSLGDWFVNEDKLKGGVAALADRIHALGMLFGIWVEPEMISQDSELYRQHPDWALQIPGRDPALSRGQLVLDVSRAEVQDHVMSQIEKVLDAAHADYVKWDMNRTLCDVGSAVFVGENAGELHHRFVLGVYAMQERLVSRYPQLLLENCSSGGGRFDPGMLYYSPQIWTSDDTDAIERLRIQEGTALVYPLSTMGAHVSKCPNEQVGRNVPVETRANVALSGTFGYELDITKMPAEERAAIPEQVSRYHRFHALVAHGDYYRLHSWDGKEPRDAWMVAAKDASEALVTVVQVLAQVNRRSIFLRLEGLDPKACYALWEAGSYAGPGAFAGQVYYGEELMQQGIRIPVMRDHESRLIHVKRAD